MRHAAAIGVIAGADGPTAIYVTTKNSPRRLLGWALFFAVLGTALAGYSCCAGGGKQ
ncbi:MAG: hypothetical protein RRY21_00905 [Oscillospiraceae bacterium]